MGLFRKRAPQPRAEDTVYVHLASDGGIFVIRGATGEQLWTDRDGLRHEIEAVVDKQAPLLIYSREAPESEPPPELSETFEQMIGFTQKKMPIQLLPEPHPEALRPPGERRSMLREDAPS